MADSGDIGAVVLAAGGSRRLGTPKQLLAHQGEPLVRRAASAALDAGLGPVVVVVGHEAPRVRSALAGMPLAIAENADWSTGIASSIRCGVRELARRAPNLRALALLVCDQPLLTREHLRVLAAAARGGAPLAASTYAGTCGVPAVFGIALVPELLALRGDAGAKAVIGRQLASAALVPLAGGEHDLDTPGDLSRLRLLAPSST
jgi:molybdenum cofactor cytidylyltransferase